ncbi:hypothetical protein ACHAQI_006092 [Fusarium lateritium]
MPSHWLLVWCWAVSRSAHQQICVPSPGRHGAQYRFAVAIADSPNVLKLQLDITSQPAINTAITTALERFGRIDVLVNNAGHGLIGEAEATTNVQARNVFETDFWGTVNLTLKALKVMREENEKTGSAGGVIMNITSVGGFIGLPGNSFYNASKFGVEGFTEAVSRELRPEWNSMSDQRERKISG